MKRIAFLLSVFACCSVLNSCSSALNDDSEDNTKGSVNPEEQADTTRYGYGSVTYNGDEVFEINSVYVHGSVCPDPTMGSTNRISMFSECFKSNPEQFYPSEKICISDAEIGIGGFVPAEHELPYYSSSYMTNLTIDNVLPSGKLCIPLKDGKYAGGNELVSSVSFEMFSFEEGDKWTTAQIKIIVSLTDGSQLAISYDGASAYDGWI